MAGQAPLLCHGCEIDASHPRYAVHARKSPSKSNDMIYLDEALTRLENIEPRQSQVDLAKILGVSLRTVEQDWSVARARLHHEISRRK